jgi:hypothetical protein
MNTKDQDRINGVKRMGYVVMGAEFVATWVGLTVSLIVALIIVASLTQQAVPPACVEFVPM